MSGAGGRAGRLARAPLVRVLATLWTVSLVTWAAQRALGGPPAPAPAAAMRAGGAAVWRADSAAAARAFERWRRTGEALGEFALVTSAMLGMGVAWELGKGR